MDDMLSSGGLCTEMSFERSPCVGFEAEAADDCWPKRDIEEVVDGDLLEAVLVGLKRDISWVSDRICGRLHLQYCPKYQKTFAR